MNRKALEEKRIDLQNQMSAILSTAKTEKRDLTEDEAKTSDKNIQDLTDKYIKDIDVVTAQKTKEIMEI